MNVLRKLSSFCESFTTPPSPVLHELERETYLNTLSPQMLCGLLQGQFLAFISKMTKPETILEIGTFTGYASICLASGLRESGVLHTIEINPELEFISSKYFEKANLAGKIVQHIGDAHKIIPGLSETFDIVFIDASKDDNEAFYDLVFGKVKPGGLILIDNVLWDGKVMNPNKDSDTLLIEAFNQKVHSDKRVENIMLPIRDGIMLLRKLNS